MQKIQLSIIIPHYNSADLLEYLLSTIPNNEDIQVIVVDDHSNQKLKEYEACKAKYSQRNIEFYDNSSEKKSAGAARNTGLQYAKGKWLLFADADDYFLPGFYGIVSAYFECEYDIIYFTPISIDVNTKEESIRHRSYERFIRVYRGNPSLKNLLNLKYSFEAPWSKLIRHSLFEENGVFFDEVMVANDTMASVKSAYYARKVYASEEIIYCITKGDNTLTSTMTRETYNKRLDVYFRKYRFLKENLSKEEYNLMNFKVQSRLYSILFNRLGKFFYIKVFFKIVGQGIPFWRELRIYKYLFDKDE